MAWKGEGDSLGFWVRTGTVAAMQRDHAHADIEVNFLFRGGMRYFFGGRFVDVPPGCFTAFWAAIPHQAVHVEPHTEIGWVCVPLAQFLRWDIGAQALKGLLRGELAMAAEASPEDGERLRRWAKEWAGEDAYDLRTIELEVEARMRRLLRGRGSRPPQAAAAGGRVEAIALWLGEHFREDLNLADIGRAIGLHPNYAMTLFRSACGMSIWTYVTRLRLAHAQRLLATTDRTTLAIAMESGFGSLNRFYAAFRAEFGTSPGKFRRRR
jgi:AraC-like DNA-binding protein